MKIKRPLLAGYIHRAEIRFYKCFVIFYFRIHEITRKSSWRKKKTFVKFASWQTTLKMVYQSVLGWVIGLPNENQKHSS